MIVSALVVFGQAIWKLLHLGVPEVTTMGTITGLALIANMRCLFLLTRHKNDNVNIGSVWVCSRNDLIANISVLLAAGVVALTNSPWPDIIVGMAVTILFLRAGLMLMRAANSQLSPG